MIKQHFSSSIKKLYSLLIAIFFYCTTFSQDSANIIKKDSSYFAKQKDLIDIFLSVVKKDAPTRTNAAQQVPGKIYISGSPAIEYSLQTGLAFNMTTNFAFYTSNLANQNISSLLTAPTFTQNQQILIPLQSSIWTKGNKWNFVGDWRFLKYPENTYGLGGYTLQSNGYKINYNYVRFYQFAEYTIKPDMYVGAGYQLDNHWNIAEMNPTTITDFQKYGFSNSSRSSGVSINFLFDNRRNSINPEGGFYSNIVLRQNMKWLGSDANWTGALIDIRKYIKLSPASKNILAIWSYNWLTLFGNPPYLDLPSNGWDTYSNTGRGYAQSRFRSKNFIDIETEYRFGILANGLLGGIVFGNLQAYSEVPSNSFQTIQPGFGAGLRVKFNKFSRTNICIDYGFGKNGSSGLFLNLGEVF